MRRFGQLFMALIMVVGVMLTAVQVASVRPAYAEGNPEAGTEMTL